MKERERRICFLGDSITAGTGDRGGPGWVGRLTNIENAETERLTSYNLGIRRDTSRRLALRWRQEWSARQSPRRESGIVLMIGINDSAGAETGFDGVDYGMRVPPEESLGIARSMVSAMQVCAPLLWLGPTPVIEEMVVNETRDANLPPRLQCLAELTAGYREIAASLGVPFLDVGEILDSSDGYTKSLKAGDGTHPTGDGHQLIADIVTAWPEWRRVMDG